MSGFLDRLVKSRPSWAADEIRRLVKEKRDLRREVDRLRVARDTFLDAAIRANADKPAPRTPHPALCTYPDCVGYDPDEPCPCVVGLSRANA